jgi:hypothetical protein
MLYDACAKLDSIITNSENYQLLVRMLQDQTTIDENNKLTPKDGKGIASTSLQNPTDQMLHLGTSMLGILVMLQILLKLLMMTLAL